MSETTQKTDDPTKRGKWARKPKESLADRIFKVIGTGPNRAMDSLTIFYNLKTGQDPISEVEKTLTQLVKEGKLLKERMVGGTNVYFKNPVSPTQPESRNPTAENLNIPRFLLDEQKLNTQNDKDIQEPTFYKANLAKIDAYDVTIKNTTFKNMVVKSEWQGLMQLENEEGLIIFEPATKSVIKASADIIAKALENANP
jgi:hypothetical protein